MTLLLTIWLATLSNSLANIMPSLGADANIQEDGIIYSVTSTTLLQGGSGVGDPKDRATVFVFQLPDFGVEEAPFTNAKFEFNYESKTNSPPSADLYGLGRRATPTVLTSDYYGETTTTDPSDAVRLQTSILTTATSVGKISTIGSASTSLRDYLNDQYQGGIGAGEYVFLRLSSAAPITSVARYQLSSSDSTTAANRPVITFNIENTTAARPFIWVRDTEKQGILDKIDQHPWAESVYDAMVARAAPALTSHLSDRDAFIRELPVLWSSSPVRFKTIPAYSESEVRFPITAKYDNALDCAVLYYLTGNEAYAECAADILHNSIRALLPVAPGTNVNNSGWIFQSDILKEARVMGNQLPIIYDFLYNYLQTNQVYDVQTGGMVDFNFTNAQNVFRKYYQLTRDHGQLVSNWSALMSNCMLQNLLALDDETERNTALNVYLTTGTSRQHSLATDHQIFTDAGNIWPESLLYAYDVNRIRSNHLVLIDRIYPERNAFANYIEFPANLYRISQLRYPNNEQISFGDMRRPASKEPYFEYELAYQQAKKRGFDDLAAALGGRLKHAIQTGDYDRSDAPSTYESLGMHNEPLQLLWQAESIDEYPVANTLPRTDRVPFAGIALQRNPSPFDNHDYGLMGFVGGAAHIHSHASGMSMELYGAGEVMGAKSGNTTYGTALHEEYYRSFASNNTVIVNGGSRGQGGWADIAINTVQTVDMEPLPFEEPVSDNHSFTISSFVDDKGTLAEATQERTLALVRTSPTSGFYVDVFRTKSTVTNRTATTLDGSVTNQYHDYIYRNFGDISVDPQLDGSSMPLVSQTNRFANDIGDTYKQPGWRYFENVKVSHPLTGSMKTVFSANVGGTMRHMDMHMPAVATREYANVDSPPIRDAPAPYHTAKAPTMVVRQIGEAWNNAFVSVYEPYFGANGPTIQSVTALKQGGVVCGVRVESLVDGNTLIHYIISQPNPTDTYHDPSIGLTFTGRFGITSLMQDQSSRLYVGSGSSISYRGNTINTADDSNSQFEGYFSPNAEPVVTANSPVETVPAKLPLVSSMARSDAGLVTIEASGTIGTPYTVEASTTLIEGQWTEISEGIITESPFTIEIPEQNETQKFYRIRIP